MGGMSVSIYMKGNYEELHALGRRKNKPNSKPNKLVLSRVEWSQFAKYLDRPHGRAQKERCKIMDFAL